jgi:hypothetical protein
VNKLARLTDMLTASLAWLTVAFALVQGLHGCDAAALLHLRIHL